MRRDRIGPERTVDLHLRDSGGWDRIGLDDCGCAMDVPSIRCKLGWGGAGAPRGCRALPSIEGGHR